MDENVKNVTINASDKIFTNDGISSKRRRANPGKFWRTEVIGGYNLKKEPGRISTLGEVLFTQSNTVPIGGVQRVFESLFNIQGPLTVPTLYSEYGIGKADSSASENKFETPTGDQAEIYRPGNRVWLFGVGITGAAENDVTVYPVDYREHGINMNVVNSDGVTLEGVMIPFRYTTSELSETDKVKYFGKKTDSSTGYTAYYLKTFDSVADISHLYITGEESDDTYNETEATDSDVWVNQFGDNAITSICEIVLRLSTKDVKEWFTYLSQEDRCRINTLALYTGEYIVEGTDDDMGDYRDCRMFSKLNIQPQYLSQSVDFTVIYRIYGS